MTEPASVFRRLDGEGWLILGGSIPELGGETADLMDRLLAHLDLSRPIAAIVAADAEVGDIQELLEAVEMWLGTEAGVLELDTDLDVAGWDESGLLLLIGDEPEPWIEALQGEPGARLSAALKRGGIVFAMGGAAAAFGDRVAAAWDDPAPMEGLAWLPGTMVLVDPTSPQDEVVLSWLQESEPRTVVKLDPGSVLALGPEGEVERWSQIPPEIVLGSGWRSA
jgi:hypothetical protein